MAEATPGEVVALQRGRGLTYLDVERGTHPADTSLAGLPIILMVIVR